MRPPKKFRYVTLLAAGGSIFLGLVILGELLGVLRHVEVPRMFGGWIKLSPSVQEWAAQWAVWALCLLIPISQSTLALARRRTRPEPIVTLTFLIFPSLSLLIMFVSPNLGATLLLGSGFLVVYVVTSRSQTFLDIDSSSARRLVYAVVFALLGLTAAGGVICVLLWQTGAFFGTFSWIRQIVMDILLGILSADLKTFYLAQPIHTAIFLVLALAAITALFREPARRLAEPFVRPLMKESSTTLRAPPHRGSAAHSSLAYLTLSGALLFGIAATAYPLLQLHWIGADFPWYVRELTSIASFLDVAAFFNRDRGLFLLLLFLARMATGLSAEEVVRFAPVMLSVLLALSSFFLVREGTGRLWVSSFAALLSVVSVQTCLGLYGGIIANWFALAIVNFTFAMIIRSIRLRSRLSAVGSIVLSLVLLVAYAYMWVVSIVELLLALAGLLATFRAREGGVWKYDVGILFGIILGIVLIPFVFIIVFITVTRPHLGLRPEALNPTLWFALGWRYIQAAQGETVGTVLSTLEYSLAQSQMQLPFVVLLSVLGLLDHAPQTCSFTKIMAAIVLVPLAIELVPNAPSYFVLRGLYLVPLYVLAALGAESIIRRVNNQERAWNVSSDMAFAAAFTSYLFLSQLGYLLRMFGLPLLPLP